MNKQIPEFYVNNFLQPSSNYCLCIPIINEGQKIIQQLKEINEQRLDEIIDIFICDGGSTDGSTNLDLLQSLHVNTLLVKQGPGKLSTQLRMGFFWALEKGYKGIITMDGNNKDSVSSIPLFIDGLDQGFDFLQGSRFIKGGQGINTPIIRFLALRIIHVPIISFVAKFKFTDTTNGFRAYSRFYLTHPEVQPFRDIFNTYELLAYLSVRASQLGLKVKEIPVIRSYPKTGKIPTKISILKGNLLLLKILLNTLLGKYNPT